MSEVLARLRALFEGLAPRERLLVAVAGGLILVLVLWLALVRPVGRGITGSERRAVAADRTFQSAVALRRELDEVQGRLARVESRIQRSRAGNVFSILEALARKAAVKVDSMEPQASPESTRYRETKVQVALKGLTLAQLVQYLHFIESAPELLSIKSLRIRTRPDKPDLLDVTFMVSSFEPV
jgi:type II secretory pathway component PulM